MGWTSVAYNKAEHLTLTGMEALRFMIEEYYQYSILQYYFVNAKDQWEHNELYTIMQHPNGTKFICVFIIDIKDGDIYWKEIEESMGPAYTNCPKQFFEEIKAPNKNAVNWRKECERKIINYKHVVL